jgi:glutamate dehydrogenase
MFLAARRLVERSARWLVRHGRVGGDGALAATVDRYRGPVDAVLTELPALVVGDDAATLATESERLVADGVPRELATRVGSFVVALGALAVTEVADATGRPVHDVAIVFFALADRLRLGWLRDRIAALPRGDRWQTEARAALRDDVADLHRELVEAVVRAGSGVEAWLAGRADAVERYLGVVADVEAGGAFDLATLGAVRRELRDVRGTSAAG